MVSTASSRVHLCWVPNLLGGLGSKPTLGSLVGAVGPFVDCKNLGMSGIVVQRCLSRFITEFHSTTSCLYLYPLGHAT